MVELSLRQFVSTILMGIRHLLSWYVIGLCITAQELNYYFEEKMGAYS